MNYSRNQINSTSRHFHPKKKKIRTLPCTTAALVLVALSASSCIDTIHGFSESFPVPLHLTLSKTNARTTSSFPEAPFLSRSSLTTNSKTYSRDESALFTATSLLYAPNQHTSKTAPMVAQAFFASHKRNRNPTKPKTRSDSMMPLSNSDLSSSDSLPSFPTAHGLLSPETVMRMEVMTNNKSSRDKALDMFLETYKKEGPMACLPMLSDENVLPRLTEAMRDMLM